MSCVYCCWLLLIIDCAMLIATMLLATRLLLACCILKSMALPLFVFPSLFSFSLSSVISCHHNLSVRRDFEMKKNEG